MDDGGVGGFGIEHGVEWGIEGQGRGGFVIEQLVALIGEGMIDASQREFPCRDGVCLDSEGIRHEGVVQGDVFFFILRKEVEIVLKSGTGDFDVIGGVAQVGKDRTVVAFMLLGIDAIVKDAAVFLHFQFVPEPVRISSVTLVFCGV